MTALSCVHQSPFRDIDHDDLALAMTTIISEARERIAHGPSILHDNRLTELVIEWHWLLRQYAVESDINALRSLSLIQAAQHIRHNLEAEG